MEKKQILVLTSIYPAPDIKISNNTSVVHYFAREWVKQGYKVLVVHNYPIYIRLFHWIANSCYKMIASRFNTCVTAVYQRDDVEYEMEGVKVIRMPLYKPLPRYSVPKKSIDRQIQKIVTWCKKQEFVPDYITSHNFYPHIDMVNRLKDEYFPNVRTCVVIHKQLLRMLNYIEGDYHEAICKVDLLGYRSLPIKREFENYSGVIPKRQFLCYSGVPSHFLENIDLCKVSKPIKHFVYVGSFIRRKYPEKLLLALKKSRLKDFTLDYVGDGANRKFIENIIAQFGWQKHVRLHGMIQRDLVPHFISKAQCFIMISEEETFGLVYLEAMSLGCITIASRNEGMEGIIEDGVNGFLCQAGDEYELVQIIDRINTLSDEELSCLSENARNTAIQLTDEKVAQIYLDELEY